MSVNNKKKFRTVIIPDECKGCNRCVVACPKQVLIMTDLLNCNGVPYAQYTGDGCIGCGACFYSCPEPGAITVLEETEE
ncbi:MAG: ferredoxin family protein [Victivallales bacterium]|nr:ferredoxin family protein [Victivallales bacterium]